MAGGQAGLEAGPPMPGPMGRLRAGGLPAGYAVYVLHSLYMI